MNIKTWQVAIISVLFFVVAYFTSSSAIEVVSAVTGLLCVWLCARENIWNYPVGFVNIGCFMWIFWEVKLYADFTLQILFFVLGIYGWIYWLRNRGDAPVRPTTKLTITGWAWTAATVIGFTLLWGWSLQTFTDASIPFLDAFVAMLSIVAQILLSSKKFENWYLWIMVDVISVGMYWYKDLHLISILYFFFLLNAVYGLIAWKKNYK